MHANLIGSGPFEMDVTDYSPGVAADVYAYDGYFQFSPIQTFIAEGEVAEHAPNTNTHWIGDSHKGATKVNVKVQNNHHSLDFTVEATLFEDNIQIGSTSFAVAARGWAKLSFGRSVSGGPGTTAEGGFRVVIRWSPEIDVWAEVIVFKVTVDGDVISTGDISGVVDVNMFDALKVASNWGPNGAYTYPPADINWDGNVGLTEALIIVGNFGAAGA